MAKVGYARVSSHGQSLDVQIEALEKHGCSKIFSEKRSATCDKRPKLKECFGYLREGDVLCVTKLDRLARSTLHLCQIAQNFQEEDIGLCILDQQVDTSTSAGKLLFNVLAVISEFENEIRKERQIVGIAKAKERGVKFGRSKKLSSSQIQELKDRRKNGVLIKDLMEAYHISKTSVYRYLGEKN